jgi:uncharacterized protein YecE (DUF72 family)
MAIRIGCGSWTDSEYVGLLYPKGLPAKERLRTYATLFERIEVNSTYYATPPRATVAGWVEQTPPDFLFDVKLPRAFSDHPQRSAESDLAEKLLDALHPLIAAKKLGAFLLTLAPGFGPESHHLDELDLVARKLQPHAPLAVELRHRGWIEGDALAATLDYFRRSKLVWVALDLPRIKSTSLLPPLDEVTHPRLAYLRLHGRNPNYLKGKTAAERHQYDYTETELKDIATRIQSLATRAKDVHVSVNNHFANFAPKAALALRRLLGQPVPPALPPGGGEDRQLSLLD